MKKNIRILAIFIIINLLISISFNIFYYKVKAVNQNTSTDINSIDVNKYPKIQEKIQELKKQHPNWNFKILYTGIEWKDAVSYQYTGHGTSPKNLVPDNSSYRGEWICEYCGDTAYDSGSWKCASESAIKYMMDPRASLNSTDIFQFLELSFNKELGYSKEVLSKMTKGSFLNNDTYLNVIMDSCQKNNVNPYYIVARIIQEQGKNGSVLVKGQGYNGQYVGYYNVFNIGASGSNKDKVILNGLAKAKNNGWTSLEKSIEEGIKIIANKYIAVGQNTLYLQKFDVDNSDGKLYWHQYMQNILAAQKDGTTLRTTFLDINSYDNAYTFIIPVYENMPVNTCSRPQTTATANYIEADLVQINVTSSLRVRNEPNGSKTVGYLYAGEIVTRLEKATSKINGTYWDKILKADGTEGYVARCTYDKESVYKEYLVPVREENTTLNDNQTDSITNSNTNNTNENNSSSENTTNSEIVRGDVNEDGKITSSDYVLIKNHIMGTKTLNEQSKKYADYNQDGKVTSSDYVLIKNYIMSR